MKAILIGMLVYALCGSAHAGAAEGEFLGFAIGARLDGIDASLIEHNLSDAGYPKRTTIPATTDLKPANMDFILLDISPIEHEVLGISGRFRLASAEDARQLERQYREALEAAYPDWNEAQCHYSDSRFVGEDRIRTLDNVTADECSLCPAEDTGLDIDQRYCLTVKVEEVALTEYTAHDLWLTLSITEQHASMDDLSGERTKFKEQIQEAERAKIMDSVDLTGIR